MRALLGLVFVGLLLGGCAVYADPVGPSAYVAPPSVYVAPGPVVVGPAYPWWYYRGGYYYRRY